MVSMFILMSQSRPLFHLFSSFLIPISNTISILQIEKSIGWAWDLNPGLQDSKRRRNHGAMAAAQDCIEVYWRGSLCECNYIVKGSNPFAVLKSEFWTAIYPVRGKDIQKKEICSKFPVGKTTTTPLIAREREWVLWKISDLNTLSTFMMTDDAHSNTWWWCTCQKLLSEQNGVSERSELTPFWER